MKLDVLLFPVLLLLIHSANGFLLDGPTNGRKQTTANSRFLTETEFLQAKKLIQQSIYDLRRDTDKTFAFLTSQLKSKFYILETKLAEVDKRNETNNDCISMEKYVALEHTLSNVEQKLANVEQKLTNAQRKNNQVEQENKAVKNVLFALKNNFSKLDIKIKELQKLGTIKPLQEFNALQQNVHLNTDKIRSLTINEQAHSQDFQALYNITTATGRKLTEMETNTNNLILQLEHNQTMTMNDMKQGLDNQLTSFQTSYNATVNDLEIKEINPVRQSVQLNIDKIHSLAMNEQARSQDFFALYNITTSTRKKVTEMETSTNNLVLQLKHNHTTEMKAMMQILDSQLTSFQTSYNSTINDLQTKEISMQKQITENNESVALFAWSSGKTGSVIQFNGVKFSVGIRNISAFKNSGTFICEKEGLYLIAATVSSKDSYASFCIRREGGNIVSCAEIGQHSGDAWHGGTSVVAQHLQVNDKIYVDTVMSIESAYWTHFTLMKIK